MSSQEDSDPCRFGEVCWLEIPVKDPSRALPFYREVFGWDCKDEGLDSKDPGVMKIFFFSSKGGNTQGCFMHVEPNNFLATSLAPMNENKERWAVTTTFAVASVDETLRKVEQSGGRVYLPKRAIGGDMGFYGRFVDTEGSVHGVHSMKE
ncbi:Glyoxalase/bleomycin resistance protein/dioxygenase [Talaromyces proteolyticus]|uniref:Glyoxalase/bleomycin resistance protein/dioxygenase n=1 Tax=Talaromyces proteolyticus TaxID=1131652 RepID=A0AAD4L0R4_9EURO|nr:Glyoxalase/bleomycin resistance protein/dioxygenase [Talaromyces proteolyticus]KAH8704108.1 Glyoxalase/bleomycin resistance protein/dioxygenase [Talaromyces proteolyticus]